MCITTSSRPQQRPRIIVVVGGHTLLGSGALKADLASNTADFVQHTDHGVTMKDRPSPMSLASSSVKKKNIARKTPKSTRDSGISAESGSDTAFKNLLSEETEEETDQNTTK